MSQSLSQFVDSILNEALYGLDGTDEFKRIPIRIVEQVSPRQPPRFRVPPGRPISFSQARDHLTQKGSVFLVGATKSQAREWARHLANRLNGTVSQKERHKPKRDNQISLRSRPQPHFHVNYGQNRKTRTGHIYYGIPPTGLFFEDDR